MRIGIIGAGHIGGTLAGLFVSVGHEVAVSNSRGPETLEGLVTELGDRACAMTAQDAARFGDVVVVVSVSGRYGHFPASIPIAPPPASSCRHTCRMLGWSRPSTP